MSPNKKERFRELYLTHKDKVYRLCLGFVGEENEAKDLFQEVMLRIWDKLDNFRGDSQISTWMYRIATNTALLTLNRNKKREKQQAPLPLEIGEEEKPAIQEGNSAKIARLRTFISQLKEIDRLVMTLLLEGCTYQEIADITGLSMSNVGVKIKRLKERIKKKFQEHERRA